jgi:hypothetical protein
MATYKKSVVFGRSDSSLTRPTTWTRAPILENYRKQVSIEQPSVLGVPTYLRVAPGFGDLLQLGKETLGVDLDRHKTFEKFNDFAALLSAN